MKTASPAAMFSASGVGRKILAPSILREPGVPLAKPDFVDAQSRLPWRKLLWYSAIPLLALAVRAIPGEFGITGYGILVGYALIGRRQALVSLAMLFLLNIFTHAFAYPPALAGLARHFVVVSAAFSVLVLHAGKPPRTTIPVFLHWTAGILALLVIHSMFFSTNPEVSVLKAFLFIMVIETLLIAWSSLNGEDRLLAQQQVLALLAMVTVLGLPFLPSTLGYVRNGVGFQGITTHPQMLGAIMGWLAAWLTASWLASKQFRLLPIVLFCGTLLSLYFSMARVGLAVYLAGISAAICANPLRRVVDRWKGGARIRSTKAVVGTLVLLICLVTAGPFLQKTIQGFVEKHNQGDTVIDKVLASRLFMIDRMMENIKTHPILGIGFGVASSEEWYGSLDRDPIFGLVIMASVEKGVLPVALVEELGFPLGLLFAVWIIALFLLAVRAGPVPAAVSAAALATNVAEACFFSAGGHGLGVMVLVTMAATAGRHAGRLPPRQGV